jgi:hypothetical protein
MTTFDTREPTMTPPDKQPLVPALRSLLEEEARSEHPTPERLIDYQSGWLTAEERGRIEAHLRTCQECKELLADLAAFEAHVPAPVAAAQPDREAQAAWKRLQGQLPKDEKKPATVRPLRPVPSPEAPQTHQPDTFWARPRTLSLLAAALFAVSIGLGVWVVSLKTKIGQLSQPTANVAAFELHLDAVRSGGTTTISGGSEPILFLLDPPEGQSSVELRAEIRKVGAAEPLLKVGGLHQMETGTLNVFVPRSLLPPGEYQIDLLKELQPLASYRFAVSSP